MEALRAKFVLVAVTLALPVTVALAADYASVIEQRKRAYGEIGAAFKGINDQLRRPAPTLMLVKRYTAQINRQATAQVAGNWFPAGSGPEAGIKTAAKPAIWSQTKKFRSLQLEFKRSSDAFSTAVNSGNVEVIRSKAKAMGEVCAACHRDFRERI